MSDNNVKFEGSNWSLLDQVVDYIPVVSTISNGIVALKMKAIAKKKLESPQTDTQSTKAIKQHYWTHIKNKSGWRIFFGLIPVIGNGILLGSDLLRGIRYLLVLWNPKSLKNKDKQFQRDFLLTHPKNMQQYKQYVSPKVQKEFFVEKSVSFHDSDDSSSDSESEKMQEKLLRKKLVSSHESDDISSESKKSKLENRKRKFDDDEDFRIQKNEFLDNEESLVESSSDDEASNEKSKDFFPPTPKVKRVDDSLIKFSRESAEEEENIDSLDLGRNRGRHIFRNPWGSNNVEGGLKNQKRSQVESSEETSRTASYEVIGFPRTKSHSSSPILDDEFSSQKYLQKEERKVFGEKPTENPNKNSFVVFDSERTSPEIIYPKTTEKKEKLENITQTMKETEERLRQLKEDLEKRNN